MQVLRITPLGKMVLSAASAVVFSIGLGASGAALAASCPSVGDPQGVNTSSPYQLDLSDYEGQIGHKLALSENPLFAAQVDGQDVLTIEGVAKDGVLHPMQEAFREHHGLQCGFCTPGMVMAALDLVRRIPSPDETTIRTNLDGNMCRCTGYHNIVKAIDAGAKAMAGAG